jgi:hypothetical protein
VKRLILIAAALFALTATAHAFGDIVIAAPEKDKPYRGNGVDHAFPYDIGRLNESPIRGKGRISVNHNEPANSPKTSGYTVDEINKASDFLGRPHLGTSRVLSDK